MRFPRCLAILPLLLAGCAEYFGNAHRLATIDVRVPSITPGAVAAETARLTAGVGALAARDGFTLRARQEAGRVLVVVPGYTGGPWPGQPDVDWGGGTTWELILPRSHDVADTIRCTLFPPRTGNVLLIDMQVEYAAHMPPAAKAFWADLKAEVTATFGREAILKVEDLR